MRALFLIRDLKYGGSQRQLANLAIGLRQRGHDVTIAVFYPGGQLESLLATEDVQIVSLDKRGRWDIAHFMRRLVGIVGRQRPDVIHGYLTMSNILTIALKGIFRRPVVWGVRSSRRDLKEYGLVDFGTKRVEFGLSRLADLIICNSHAGREFFVESGSPRLRTVVIPNGIDTELFEARPGPAERVRAEWDIAPDQPLIGVVGRLQEVKDHETFLRAASLLSQRQPSARFVCVGDGSRDFAARLRTIAGDLNLTERVVWAGGRSDMPAVYSALDLLALTSRAEGFPNVVCEAMACETPCVVTDVGDCARIVGELGGVVPRGDPAAMAAEWERFLKRLTRRPPSDCCGESNLHLDGAALRERIVAKFSFESLVDQTESALLDLL